LRGPKFEHSAIYRQKDAWSTSSLPRLLSLSKNLVPNKTSRLGLGYDHGFL
jgi:hypothetical protein